LAQVLLFASDAVALTSLATAQWHLGGHLEAPTKPWDFMGGSYGKTMVDMGFIYISYRK